MIHDFLTKHMTGPMTGMIERQREMLAIYNRLQAETESLKQRYGPSPAGANPHAAAVASSSAVASSMNQGCGPEKDPIIVDDDDDRKMPALPESAFQTPPRSGTTMSNNVVTNSGHAEEGLRAGLGDLAHAAFTEAANSILNDRDFSSHQSMLTRNAMQLENGTPTHAQIKQFNNERRALRSVDRTPDGNVLTRKQRQNFRHYNNGLSENVTAEAFIKNELTGMGQGINPNTLPFGSRSPYPSQHSSKQGKTSNGIYNAGVLKKEILRRLKIQKDESIKRKLRHLYTITNGLGDMNDPNVKNIISIANDAKQFPMNANEIVEMMLQFI